MGVKGVSLIIIILVCCTWNNSYAQQNLVPNPSFEIFSACPSGPEGIGYFPGGDAPPWYYPTQIASADYFNACASPLTGCSVPYCDVFNGFQYARTGVAFAGLLIQMDTTGTVFFPPSAKYSREYVQAPLLNSLKNGEMYCVTFYVNLMNGACISVDDLGALFTATPDTVFNDSLPLLGAPQVLSTPNIFLTDTLNWMKIEGHFIAKGDENYITIGVFNLSLDQKPTSVSCTEPYAYYNIDDVSVRQMPKAIAGNDTTIYNGSSITLGGTAPNLPGSHYHWSPSTGLSDTNTSQPIANPSQTTTYTLIASSDSCTCRDTGIVTITVEYIEPIFVPTAFSPNGDGQNDILLIKGNYIATIDFIIYDRWGNKVFESKNQDDGWDGTYKGQPQNAGTYVYYLSGTYANGSTFSRKGTVALVR